MGRPATCHTEACVKRRETQTRYNIRNKKLLAEKSRTRYHTNPDKERKRKKDAYWADPEKGRAIALKSHRIRRSDLRRYGITKDDYNVMFDEQQGKCAICGVHQDDVPKAFHVDHDHITGKVRGLLCFTCNIMLGNAKDNPDVLCEGALYLERTKGLHAAQTTS